MCLWCSSGSYSVGKVPKVLRHPCFGGFSGTGGVEPAGTTVQNELMDTIVPLLGSAQWYRYSGRHKWKNCRDRWVLWHRWVHWVLLMLPRGKCQRWKEHRYRRLEATKKIRRPEERVMRDGGGEARKRRRGRPVIVGILA